VKKAASTSETSVNVCQTTWINNPEDSHFQTRCRENVTSHKVTVLHDAPFIVGPYMAACHRKATAWQNLHYCVVFCDLSSGFYGGCWQWFPSAFSHSGRTWRNVTDTFLKVMLLYRR
jgi:hypothetical protein